MISQIVLEFTDYIYSNNSFLVYRFGIVHKWKYCAMAETFWMNTMSSAMYSGFYQISLVVNLYLISVTFRSEYLKWKLYWNVLIAFTEYCTPLLWPDILISKVHGIALIKYVFILKYFDLDVSVMSFKLKVILYPSGIILFINESEVPHVFFCTLGKMYAKFH